MFYYFKFRMLAGDRTGEQRSATEGPFTPEEARQHAAQATGALTLETGHPWVCDYKPVGKFEEYRFSPTSGIRWEIVLGAALAIVLVAALVWAFIR